MLKIFLKRIIKFILIRLNLIRFFLLFAPKNRLIILTYHRISESKGKEALTPFDIGVTREKFEKQMRYLSRNFSAISFSQAVKLLKNEKGWPKFPIVISFDDGYRDVILNAFPYLERYGLPAIVFVSTRLTEQGGSFWWDELKDLVEKNYLEEIKLAMVNNFSPEYDLDLDSLKVIKDKKVFLDKLVEEFKKLKGRHRDEFLTKLKALLKKDQESKRELLSWEEIKKLRRAGIEIGSHAHSHYLLTLEDEKTIEEELRVSKKILEENLKEKIEFLSYPSGLYNSKIKKLAEQAGYMAACSTLYGYNQKGQDYYALKRFSLEEAQTLDEFKISLGRLLGALPFLKD